MPEQQQVRVGQVWRRKKNGRLFRIVRAYPFDDWNWEGVDYKASGRSYGDYIRRGSELVEDAKEGSR